MIKTVDMVERMKKGTIRNNKTNMIKAPSTLVKCTKALLTSFLHIEEKAVNETLNVPLYNTSIEKNDTNTKINVCLKTMYLI